MKERLTQRLKEVASEREVVETISAEAERMVATGTGPTPLIEAVIEADLADLAPLAAERHHHAWVQRESSRIQMQAARSAPLFRDDKGTLYATFSPFLSEDSFPLFADRVLAAVLEKPPTRVVFIPPAKTPGEDLFALLADQITELKKDLELQGITAIP